MPLDELREDPFLLHPLDVRPLLDDPPPPYRVHDRAEAVGDELAGLDLEGAPFGRRDAQLGDGVASRAFAVPDPPAAERPPASSQGLSPGSSPWKVNPLSRKLVPWMGAADRGGARRARAVREDQD